MDDDQPGAPTAEGGHSAPRTLAAEVLAESLLELARSAAEDDLSEVLESVADTILRTSGFRTVVLNVFRPAWDDYEAVLVVGGQESSGTLLGSHLPREAIERLVASGDEVLSGVHLLTDDSPVWDEFEHVFTPVVPASQEPDRWRAEDALLVMLRDGAGGPLGFVSVDEPASGLRPGTAELRLLRSVCSYAEQALRSAQRSRRAEDDKQLLERLSRVSPRLSTCGSRDELYGLVTMLSVAGLGFERVGLYAAEGTDAMRLRQSRGSAPADPVPATLERAQLERLLRPELGESGCWLVDSTELYGDRATGSRRSPRNGVGPLAWADQALLIPWYRDADVLTGVLMLEDPTDHLLPAVERRNASRLLVDLAASVERSIAQQERLVAQASYDSLTGLRNRRGLHQLITRNPSVSVLVCDIDHFKQINDQHGHESGDHVLRLFGELLSELADRDNVAVRMGGEEFCVVLPNADAPSALGFAERLRELTPSRTRTATTGGVTVSVGVASSAEPVTDARVLLAAADRGLYAAKRAGRDRVVVADPVSSHHPEPTSCPE